jgi:hypothetical protein
MFALSKDANLFYCKEVNCTELSVSVRVPCKKPKNDFCRLTFKALYSRTYFFHHVISNISLLEYVLSCFLQKLIAYHGLRLSEAF